MSTDRRSFSLLFLRITIGLLLVWWGIDKFRDPAHGAKVAEKFYFGLGTAGTFLTIAGALEILIGAAVMVGLLRKFTYPALLLITGVTAIGVWKSVLDPWGLVLQGSVVLFYPSIIIFAGATVLYTFQDEDGIALSK